MNMRADVEVRGSDTRGTHFHLRKLSTACKSVVRGCLDNVRDLGRTSQEVYQFDT